MKSKKANKILAFPSPLGGVGVVAPSRKVMIARNIFLLVMMMILATLNTSFAEEAKPAPAKAPEGCPSEFFNHPYKVNGITYLVRLECHKYSPYNVAELPGYTNKDLALMANSAEPRAAQGIFEQLVRLQSLRIMEDGGEKYDTDVFPSRAEEMRTIRILVGHDISQLKENMMALVWGIAAVSLAAKEEARVGKVDDPDHKSEIPEVVLEANANGKNKLDRAAAQAALDEMWSHTLKVEPPATYPGLELDHGNVYRAPAFGAPIEEAR